jgi:hypothetical protein
VIGHTKAFATYRLLSQAHLNFVVLVCYAVPALRTDLALSTASLSNPPDHFKAATNSKADIATYLGAYQEELARSTLITVFSYFESYIKDALVEIVEFHGGKDKFAKLSARRASKFIDASDSDIRLNKRKLQDNPASSKLAKYQKYGKLLDSKGFKFPTELFAHFGVSQLLAKLDKTQGVQAWEIPSLLEKCLLFPITIAENDQFEKIRSLRNKIAHGKVPTIVLNNSLKYASMLHTLAAKVDRHITEHFLLIQAV